MPDRHIADRPSPLANTVHPILRMISASIQMGVAGTERLLQKLGWIGPNLPPLGIQTSLRAMELDTERFLFVVTAVEIDLDAARIRESKIVT